MASQLQLTATNVALISAIVSAILGLAFKIYIDYRTRKTQLYDKKIDFLDSSGKYLNKVFPLLFDCIHKNTPDQNRLKELDNAIFSLFQERNSVKMWAIVYFKDKHAYSSKYDQLCFGIAKVFDYLEMLKEVKNGFHDQYSKTKLLYINDKITIDINQLEESWYFDYSTIQYFNKLKYKAKTKHDVQENLYHLADLLWMRAIQLQQSKLQTIISNNWLT